jgi:hypothetical protein
LHPCRRCGQRPLLLDGLGAAAELVRGYQALLRGVVRVAVEAVLRSDLARQAAERARWEAECREEALLRDRDREVVLTRELGRALVALDLCADRCVLAEARLEAARGLVAGLREAARGTSRRAVLEAVERLERALG